MKQHINCTAILNFANAQVTDEFSKYEQLPENLQEVLRRKAKERQDNAAEEAAESILNLCDAAQTYVTRSVAEIREARKFISKAKTDIEQVERARAFGLETNNFIPLIRLVAANLAGPSMLNIEGLVLSVPEDWQPKIEKLDKAPEPNTGKGQNCRDDECGK